MIIPVTVYMMINRVMIMMPVLQIGAILILEIVKMMKKIVMIIMPVLKIVVILIVVTV
jgi:hypothetical protein